MTSFLKLHDFFIWNIHFLLYGVQRVVSTLHTGSLDAKFIVLKSWGFDGHPFAGHRNPKALPQ